eukprot:6631581-Pyramimonas_sp.AAC.1
MDKGQTDTRTHAREIRTSARVEHPGGRYDKAPVVVRERRRRQTAKDVHHSHQEAAAGYLLQLDERQLANLVDQTERHVATASPRPVATARKSFANWAKK